MANKYKSSTSSKVGNVNAVAKKKSVANVNIDGRLKKGTTLGAVWESSDVLPKEIWASSRASYPISHGIRPEYIPPRFGVKTWARDKTDTVEKKLKESPTFEKLKKLKDNNIAKITVCQNIKEHGPGEHDEKAVEWKDLPSILAKMMGQHLMDQPEYKSYSSTNKDSSGGKWLVFNSFRTHLVLVKNQSGVYEPTLTSEIPAPATSDPNELVLKKKKIFIAIDHSGSIQPSHRCALMKRLWNAYKDFTEIEVEALKFQDEEVGERRKETGKPTAVLSSLHNYMGRPCGNKSPSQWTWPNDWNPQGWYDSYSPGTPFDNAGECWLFKPATTAEFEGRVNSGAWEAIIFSDIPPLSRNGALVPLLQQGVQWFNPRTP